MILVESGLHSAMSTSVNWWWFIVKWLFKPLVIGGVQESVHWEDSVSRLKIDLYLSKMEILVLFVLFCFVFIFSLLNYWILIDHLWSMYWSGHLTSYIMSQSKPKNKTKHADITSAAYLLWRLIFIVCLCHCRNSKKQRNLTFSWRYSMRIRRRTLLNSPIAWMTSALRWNILLC